jgi:opacity protein-like surface antigen
VHYLRDNSLFKEGSLLSMGVSGGYQFVSINTPGYSYTQYFRNATFNGSYRNAIGIYINSRFSKRSNLLSVDLAMHFVTDSYYGYSEYSDGIENYRDDINIDFSEIQVPLSLRLTFGKGGIHPYVAAGGFKSFLIDQSYNRLSEGRRGESIYTEYYEDLTLDNAFGFIVGAGIQFELGKARVISLEGHYSKGSQTLTKYNSAEATELYTSVFSIMARINL